MRTFEHLFSQISINKMVLKNRIVLPAMGTNFAARNGEVTDRLIEYYAERASGGIGLVIVEVASVDFPRGNRLLGQISVADDQVIPGLTRLTKAIHETGAKVVLQLLHAGRKSMTRITGMQPVGPSAYPEYGGDLPRELTIEEIVELANAFALGAERAKKAGFDGIELHCTHGYLHNQFLSPLTNKRKDLYGGSFENRLRFTVETLKAMRKEVGEDFSIICRIGGDEDINGGITLDDAKEIAKKLEESGADAIHVSASSVPNTYEEWKNQKMISTPEMSKPLGCYSYLAGAIKKHINIPVIAVGRINNCSVGEEILKNNQADLIAMGRPLIVDPNLLNKELNGSSELVRRCIGCCECTDREYTDMRYCALNPHAGKEFEIKDIFNKKSKNKKRVIIAGGGPAGLQAAITIAAQKHEVIIYEKSGRLGGNLHSAAAVQYKAEIGNLANYFSKEINNLGIQVNFNTEFKTDMLNSDVDALILATGSLPARPDIPGVNQEHVVDALSVLDKKTRPNGHVMVMGAGIIGSETIVFLAEHGYRHLTLVTRRAEADIANDMSKRMRHLFLTSIWPKIKVEIISNCDYKEIVKEGLIIIQSDKKEMLVNADTIVYASGLMPNNHLLNEVNGKVPEVYVCGDCVKPRKIKDAIHEGFEVGLKVIS